MPVCPECRKKFSKQTATCPDCGVRLLSRPKAEASERLAPGESPDESYVELLRCSPNEVMDISSLLEPEGIVCRIDANHELRDEQGPEADEDALEPNGLIVKVRADQLSKARAILDWEAEGTEVRLRDEEELQTCPECGAEAPSIEETCPECGSPMTEQDSEDSDAGVYRCSACGNPARPDELTCSTCGARLDH